MIYHFEQFELDIARFELREDGAVQPLEPQVFTLLAYLIEHRERLVPKNELFEKLWNGRVVTDSALTSRIKSARQALGDSGKAQQFIKTIHGKGFRFIADVRFAHSTSMVLPGDGTEKPDVAIEPSQRPSISVLPFRNTADASTYDTFAGGLAHELITELARLHWLLVVARGGIDSVRTPFERTACLCRRCAARLNSAILTQLETGHVELELVKPINHCPENRTLGYFNPESSG
jgi:DNA-binding winged helix-turn-helix (wHTH) protein